MAALNTCTSTTRPSNPAPGTMLFETNTSRIIIWDGIDWRVWSADNVVSPNDWLTVEFPTVNSIYNGTGSNYISYTYAMYILDQTRMTRATYDNFNNRVNAPNNGLELFDTNDDILIDAIRIRCTRPAGGSGRFGMMKWMLWKEGSGMTTTTSSNGGNSIGYKSRAMNSAAKRDNGMGCPAGSGYSSRGINFVHTPTNVLTTSQTFSTTPGSYFQNILYPHDPRGEDDFTSAGSTPAWYTETSGVNYNQWSTQPYGDTLFVRRNLDRASSSLGYSIPLIYGGASFPQEVFYTLYFTHPLNMKKLNCIDIMPIESPSKTGLKIYFDFRKYKPLPAGQKFPWL